MRKRGVIQRMNAEQLAMARGDTPADRVLRGAMVADLANGQWFRGDVAIGGGLIVGVGSYRGRQEEDLTGRYLVPGFFDAHVHVESSLLAPEQFAALVLPRGTTTIAADPHEIANVSGLAGIDYFLEAAAGSPLDIYVLLPSCVPATPREMAGARLGPEDLAGRIAHPRVLGLGEMMDYPGVVSGDPGVHRKIQLAHAERKVVDGHLEPEGDALLQAYAGSGIHANHECTTAAQARRNLRAGMHLMIREGTAARNLSALLEAVDARSIFRCMLCTDDRHPDHIEEEGHIDSMVRRCIREGLAPLDAFRMASLHPAEFFGLRDRGLIAPGRLADILVLGDPDRVEIETVYKRGEPVARGGRWLGKIRPLPVPAALTRSLAVGHLGEADLSVPPGTAREAIGLVPGEILTRRVRLAPGEERDCLKVAVVERHRGSGLVGTAWVRGLPFRDRTVATTISHDSHNIIAAGDRDSDIRTAVDALVEMGGGLVVVSGGEVRAALPLPIAGLMTPQPWEAVREPLAAVRRAAGGEEALMALSFLALPVIPEIRITPRGLFDVGTQRYLADEKETTQGDPK